MKRIQQRLIRGVRLLTALALILSVVPLGTVSAAPIKQLDALRTAEPSVVEASTEVEPIRVERSTLRADRAAAPPVSAPQAPNAVNIIATKRDAVVNDVDGDGRADPGDTLRYTVVITNSGDTDATSVVFNDTIDDNTVVSGTIKSTPLARNDTYTAVGNVRISLAAGSGVLANDNDPDGSAITVVSSSPTSANGGNVAVNADGSFTYNPLPGFEGADTFTYTIQDTDGNQNSAIVTVTVSGMIWFINNNAGACSSGCDGRLTSPFTTLAAFAAINNGTGNNPAANDNIFVYESATAYTGGVTLLNGQRFIGQDATGSLATLAGVTPPSYSDALPAMNTGAPAATINGGTNAVALAQNNALYGFTAGTATGASISGSGFGTLLVNDVIINTTGAGLGLSTGAFGSPATFTSITSSSGSNNVSLVGVSGTANLGSGALSGASSHAFAVDGGTAVVTYSGTINNTATRSVSVINKTGGSVTFSGAVNGTAQGVFLNNNTGATITFLGGLTLSTGANAAFTATGGGTINVCDENPCNPGATGALVNTLTTTTATALNVNGTTIGANNLEFRSISSSGGAATGIILINTGATGALIVSGDGTNTTRGGNGSGGTISGKTGADGDGTVGSGVYINNGSATLRRMNLHTLDNYGLYGLSVNNVTLQYSTVGSISGAACADADGNIGTSSSAADAAIVFGRSNPGGLNGFNNAGAALLDNLLVYCAIEHQIEIYQQSNSFNATISNSDVKDNSTSFGSDGILTEMQGTANGTVNIQNVAFDDNKSQAVQGAANDSSVLDMTINQSTVTRSAQGNEGFVLSNGSNGRLIAHVTNNNISGIGGVSIFVGQTAGNANALAGGAVGLTAFIKGNTISTPASATNHAIIAFLSSTVGQVSLANILIESNTIAQNSTSGVARPFLIDTPDNNTTPSWTATVLNNNVTFVDAVFGATADVTARRGAGCFDVRNNVIAGTFGIRVRQASPATVQLEQGVSGSTDPATVLDDNHPAGTVTSVLGTPTVVGNNTCLTPPVAMLPNDNQAVAQNHAATDSLVQSEGGNSKPLLSLPFNLALVPQTDRVVNLDRVEAPIAPLNIGTLPAGKTVTLTFEVVINNPMTPGVTQVSNQGTVSGGNFSSVLTNDPDTGAANDPTVTPLDIQVDLQVTKSVNPASAYPGLPITYTISYLNAGPQASANVVITDPIPAALTGVAYQSSATITPTGLYVWTIGTLLNGHGGVITVTGTISPVLAVPTTITNTATITGTGRDTNSANNTANTGLPINDRPISGLNATNDSPTLLGSATNFTATISTGTNVVYQWNFGDGSTGSGATSSHSYATIGTYTATVTATNSTNSQVATTIVTVVDIPIAGLTATNDSPTRLGNATNFSTTISAGSNVVYAWDFGDGATGSGTAPAHTYAALGTYTATVTATNSVNQQVATSVVTVIDQPIGDLTAANDSPTLLDSATHFTASISSGTNVTYQWNFGDGVTGSGTNASHTYGSIGAYVATVTATNGVSVVVANINVSIVDVPITGLTAANSGPTVLGNSTAFTAAIGAGSNVVYAWNFGDGSTGSGVTTSNVYAAVGTYTATVTATNDSNSVVATTVVTIFDTPITGLNATSDSPTRLGNATNFTATTTGGSGIIYTWNFGDGSLTSGSNPVHTYAALGTYTATVTATNSLNSQTASTVVVVIDQPIAGLNAVNDSPTRLGSATNFTATIGNGTNVTYQWNFGDGALGNGATASHTYGAVGSYLATVTATNGVSVVVATTSVSIIDTPIVNLTAVNDSPTRLGSPTAFTATIGGGSNVTYAWNFGDGSLASGATASHTYGAVGSYLATVTVTNGVSVVVATTNVSIIDRAIVGLSAANSSPTGLGSATIFTATISDGSNVSYAWNFGDGSTGSGANVSHTYGAIGTYTATVTATNGVSVVVASTVATVINQPISGLSAANSGPTRLGSATAFTATITTGSTVSYAWNFGDGSTGSGANASHTYPAIGTYTATVTATNSINSQTASTIVVVIDQAIVGLSANNDSPTRLGSTTNLTATISDGSNVTYQWNFGDGSTGGGANTNHVYNAVGSYVATVTATNSVSVVVATTNVSIIDTPIVGLAAANSSPTGLGLSTALTATINSGSNVTYQWDFGDGSVGSGATPSHIYPALGAYTATVTATNGVSNVVATTLVTIVDQPMTTLSAASSSPTLLGNTSFFTATANGTSVVYTWNFGDGSAGAGANPTHTYAATGLYTAIVTATNSTGSLTATVKVNVFNGKIYLPTIMRNYVPAPDLVVAGLKASTGNVQMVIKNQGDLPAIDGFYVDVYINPQPAPTAVNQIWSDGRSAQGLTWGVISSLQPGQVLTLTVGDAYYLPDYSIFTGTLPVGTPVYAQVDSFDPLTTYGAVRENHEINGSPYNNILGPVLSTAALEFTSSSIATQRGEYFLPVRLKVR